jgi:hypothetical protein
MALVAALAASASFTAPVAVGPATSNPQVASPVSIQPDLRQGAWLQLTSPDGERLVRIQEDGRATAVELPLKLRGEELEITPLRDGWTVAIDRYWPGGPQEEGECQPGSSSSGSSLALRAPARIASEARCSELVVAQLSPSGRWTQVQSIPHSFGRESEASEPVETGNRIELAWSEGEQFQPIRVAVARPGHGFGRDHVAHSVLRREPNRVVTAVLHGALYLRGEYAPNPPFGTVRFWVDRQLYGNGTLGAPHVVRSGVLREPGRSLEGVNGSELWLYGGVYQKLAFARRSLWAPTFGAPRVIVRESDGGEQFAQSQNHRTLISLETPVAMAGRKSPRLKSRPRDVSERFTASNRCRPTRNTESDGLPRSTTLAARSSPRAAAKTRDRFRCTPTVRAAPDLPPECCSPPQAKTPRL